MQWSHVSILILLKFHSVILFFLFCLFTVGVCRWPLRPLSCRPPSAPSQVLWHVVLARRSHRYTDGCMERSGNWSIYSMSLESISARYLPQTCTSSWRMWRAGFRSRASWTWRSARGAMIPSLHRRNGNSKSGNTHWWRRLASWFWGWGYVFFFKMLVYDYLRLSSNEKVN